MVSPQAVAIAVLVALVYLAGEAIATGVHKLHDGEKKVVAKIAHIFHHDKKDE